MNFIEKIAYLPHLPSITSGRTGRSVFDYATVFAVFNIFVRDLITFPEGNHGNFTESELIEAVCAEVQPFDDYYDDTNESDFVRESISGLVNSGFIQRDSNGNLSCSFISSLMIDLWKNEHPKLIDEPKDTEDDLPPELF